MTNEQKRTPNIGDAGGSALEAITTHSAKTHVPPRPVHWPTLLADDAETQWRRLDAWVEYARQVFVIPDQVIPPFWHRHWVLVEQISALRLHYLAAFDISQNASAAFGFMRDLAEWQNRMREIVARLGNRPDRAYPLPTWPGQTPSAPNDGQPPVNVDDRFQDFELFVEWDVTRRHAHEERQAANPQILEAFCG